MSPRKKSDYTAIQEASREKILAAAFKLFAENSYAQTSVDSIAAEAGISKGLIYHYFENKEILLRHVFAQIKKEGDVLYEGVDSLSPQDFLQRLIHLSMAYISRQTKTFRLMIALTVQPDVTAGLKEVIDCYRSEWLGALEQVFSALHYDNPKAEAYFLAALLDGIGLGYLVLAPDYPLAEVQQLIEQRYKT